MSPRPLTLGGRATVHITGNGRPPTLEDLTTWRDTGHIGAPMCLA